MRRSTRILFATLAISALMIGCGDNPTSLSDTTFTEGTIQWSVNSNSIKSASNGHWYRAITVPDTTYVQRYGNYFSSITWDEANAAAVASGGYLVTITSWEENEFVKSIARDSDFWIGAMRSPIDGSWTWNTGEQWDFEIWCMTQSISEDRANLVNSACSGQWNDAAHNNSCQGYIVEYNIDPNPRDNKIKMPAMEIK